MRVVIHSSVPFIDARLRIWQSKGSSLGCDFIKYTPDMMLTTGDKLLIGADCSNLDQQLRDKLPTDRFLIVRDTWIEESISSGTQAPILSHVVPLSQLTPTAAHAAGDNAGALIDDSSLLQRKGQDPEAQRILDLQTAAVTAQDSDANPAKRHKQSDLTVTPPPPPPSEAAADGEVPISNHSLSPAVLDALRVITGRRLWLPAQQQQQQQQQQQGVNLPSSTKQYQQQHQQDLLHFQQQQRPLPKLDVSWMPPSAFRVVSYNILADMYCSNRNTKSYCPVHLRQWSSRWPRLAAEIAAYQPHILCLQEVDDQHWFDEVQPRLEQQLDLQGLFWCRSYQRNKGAQEGIALMFNKSRFKLLQHSSVRFADHAHTARDFQQASFWRSVCDYEEGALFALLQCNTTEQLLVVCCTHLWYSPRAPDVKVAQAELLCKCCVQFLAQQCRGHILAHGALRKGNSPAGATADVGDHDIGGIGGGLELLRHVPVIIGGDFNSLWRKYRSDAFDKVPVGRYQVSGVYELLSTGQLDKQHPHHPINYRHGGSSSSSSNKRNEDTSDAASAAESQEEDVSRTLQDYVFTTHGLRLQSSYLAARGYEPPLTNKHPGFAGGLDYVWFTGHKLRAIGTLAMPYETLGFSQVPEDPERVPFVSIPDDVWASDHLAVGAVFDWS